MQLKAFDFVWRMLGKEIDHRTGFSVHLGWCSEVSAWGWIRPFEGLGINFGLGVLVIGPIHIRVTWPLPAWPSIAA